MSPDWVPAVSSVTHLIQQWLHPCYSQVRKHSHSSNPPMLRWDCGRQWISSAAAMLLSPLTFVALICISVTGDLDSKSLKSFDEPGANYSNSRQRWSNNWKSTWNRIWSVGIFGRWNKPKTEMDKLKLSTLKVCLSLQVNWILHMFTFKSVNQTVTDRHRLSFTWCPSWMMVTLGTIRGSGETTRSDVSVGVSKLWINFS